MTRPRRRPPTRASIEDALMRARSHLTARDWTILGLLDEHRVLTATQLCDLAFNDPTTARHRLAALYRLKVVNRFRPPPADLGGGSKPYHYGALLIAQQHTVQADRWRDDDQLTADLARLRQRYRWNPDYTLAIATSQRLHHQLAVNAFFCALARAARHSGGRRELACWQGDKTAKRTGYHNLPCVRPDGYGVWAEDGGELPLFLELDRGSEPLERLAGKLDGYAQAEECQEASTWVLVSLPSQQREHGARQAMLAPGRPDVPVATTHRRLPDARRPHEAVWWPLRNHDGAWRVPLIDLAACPIPAGSIQRAATMERYRAEEAAEQARTDADRAARERDDAHTAPQDHGQEHERYYADDREEPSSPGRWKVFGRWPTGP